MVFKKTRYISIIIGIGQYEKNYIGILSVSADMKKIISVFYRYRPIRKFYLSVSADMKKGLSVLP